MAIYILIIAGASFAGDKSVMVQTAGMGGAVTLALSRTTSDQAKSKAIFYPAVAAMAVVTVAPFVLGCVQYGCVRSRGESEAYICIVTGGSQPSAPATGGGG